MEKVRGRVGRGCSKVLMFRVTIRWIFDSCVRVMMFVERVLDFGGQISNLT